jgi:hypothetical protein
LLIPRYRAAKVCDEAYFLANPLRINANGATPFNMSIDQIETAMAPLRTAA